MPYEVNCSILAKDNRTFQQWGSINRNHGWHALESSPRVNGETQANLPLTWSFSGTLPRLLCIKEYTQGKRDDDPETDTRLWINSRALLRLPWANPLMRAGTCLPQQTPQSPPASFRFVDEGKKSGEISFFY